MLCWLGQRCRWHTNPLAFGSGIDAMLAGPTVQVAHESQLVTEADAVEAEVIQVCMPVLC
jgi:hypothetical protein